MTDSLPSNRSFAPSILREKISRLFDLENDILCILLVAEVLAKHHVPMTTDEQNLFSIEKLNITRLSSPAAIHVDYSTRIQTVHRDTNPRYHALINRFQQLTGCPIVVNTSFNVWGEPIICTPEDAF